MPPSMTSNNANMCGGLISLAVWESFINLIYVGSNPDFAPE